MLTTAVIHPEALDRAHFATPGYRDQAEMLFRGLESNGLLLIDADGRLLDELKTRVQKLSTRDGQQLQIRLAELQKKQKRRIVIADRIACPCPQSQSLLDAALTVHRACRSDTLVVGVTSGAQVQATPRLNVTPLGSYIGSDYEQMRHQYLDQLPPIDCMAPGEYDQHMIRCTRWSTCIRIYDKQIGHGSSLSGFRNGIARIIELWVQNAHFPRASLHVDIYTCVQKTHKSTDTVYAAILDVLVRRLSVAYRIPVTLHFKEDAAGITHDRFLQTNSVAVSFSKGFDYVNEDGTLQRCSVKIDNGAYEHLRTYRGLPDAKPPKCAKPED